MYCKLSIRELYIRLVLLLVGLGIVNCWKLWDGVTNTAETDMNEKPTGVPRNLVPSIEQSEFTSTSNAHTDKDLAVFGLDTYSQANALKSAAKINTLGSSKESYCVPGTCCSLQIAGFHKLRSLQNLDILDYLIASDVEGGLHCINRTTGNKVWSLESSEWDSLLNVDKPLNADNRETIIIEPFGDGNLYYFNIYQGLKKLPVSIRQLILTSPMHLKSKNVLDEHGTFTDDEKIYLGSRQTLMYNIDISTGRVISVFGSNKPENYFASEYEETNKDVRTVVIGKTIYNLSIYSKDGTSYNVTYATWQPNSIDLHLGKERKDAKESLHITPLQDKSLLAYDPTFRVAKWITKKFPGIIVSLFDVFEDPVNGDFILINHPLYSGVKSVSRNRVYLDQTKSQTWFALSGDVYPSLVNSAQYSRFMQNDQWNSGSILKNDELFNTFLRGVHNLQQTEYQQILGNSLQSNNLLSLPSSNSEESQQQDDFGDFDNDINDFIYKKEISKPSNDQSLDAYKYQLRMEYLNSRRNVTAFSFLGKLALKILEFGLMLLASLIILSYLLKSNLINLAPMFSSRDQPDAEIPVVQDFTNPIAETAHILGDKTNTDIESTLKLPENMDKRNQDVSLTTEDIRFTDASVDSAKSEKEIVENKALHHLEVSDKILGYGSSGTVVFQGSFQGRPVAVKRMLLDFCDIASREIELLTESDNHPNVIRYFCSETTEKFLYIALELCKANLEDLIERKNVSDEMLELSKATDKVALLRQIASGISHLHSLKIIHRDIKPQNILISKSNEISIGPSHESAKEKRSLRVLMSDFGLCKKLDAGESSFKTNVHNQTGTSGWRAPELLDESMDLENDESAKNALPSYSFYDPFLKKRLTRSVDIFAMGCVFYYVLSDGSHPFGDKYERDANIIKNNYNLARLKRTIKDKSLCFEATDLIRRMISSDPKSRPSSSAVLKHPFFWSKSKKLEFLLKVSDRFEAERRDPPSPLLLEFDKISTTVIPNHHWGSKFDGLFIDNLGRYRKYDMGKVIDLLRALRNKYHHFMDLPEDLADVMSPIPDGFYDYFIKRFPKLLIETYLMTKESLSDDQLLHEFF